MTAFRPLTPCRILDTRNLSGANAGGPALAPGEIRLYKALGRCGIAEASTALSVNATVTGAGAAGELILFPGDLSSPPAVGTVSFQANQTRANNAILKLPANGLFNVFKNSPGPVHFILDVNGAFQ